MMAWHTEDTFDAVRVPYADLYMGFAPEACGGIDRFAFGKYGTDGVKGGATRLFAGLVQVIDDHAVEFAVEKAFAS